jgi:autotransporter-associated beta strand protein
VALRYFDRNGTTAGFGTLTGAWDTTTASWSTSSAGTATPATFTFTTADSAQFGFDGTASTAGTATISTGITVNLNALVCVANGQTIARAGTGSLVFGGTAPTVTNSGVLTVTSPIGGTSGLNKNGVQTLVLGAINTISGTFNFDEGAVQIGLDATGTPNQLDSITQLNINTTSGVFYFVGLNAHTFSVPFAGPASFIGNGSGIGSSNKGGITLSHSSSVAGFTGYFRATCSNTVDQEGKLILPTFPAATPMFLFVTSATGTTVRSTQIVVQGSGGTSSAECVLVATAAGTGTTHEFVDDSTGPSVYTGGARLRSDSNASATQTFRIAGTNTAATINGNIIQGPSLGVIALAKAGAGKWALSGANTYTGTTTISAGTLSAQSASALGRDSSLSGGAISVTGGTLELAGGITLDKSGLNISTVTTASPTNAFQVPASGGDNTLEVGSITLNSTILVDVGANAALRFANTGAITGSTFGITKNGTGELDLNAAANQFTGATTVAAGTLTVSASCAPSVNGPLGNASSAVALTGTLKYDGAANSTISRSVQLTGSTPALEASGSGHIHFSNVSQASGSRTLTLKGASTTTNQFQSAFGDASGGTTSVTKDGTGRWQFTGVPSYTGTTTVNAGLLDFGGQTVTLPGGVSMTGGVLANGTLDDTLEADVTFTGGTLEALLDGAVDVNAVSGTGRLYPVTSDGSNTYSGETDVQVGATLELVTDANPASAGYGKVTGASDVVVGGTLATGRGTNQRGQCRYGGNLTFAAGSVLAIGAAA